MPVPPSLELLKNLRHRLTNVPGHQVVHFYPPVQPSLLVMLQNLPIFWTATFICTERIVQYLLHPTVTLKTKLHGSSLLCCRVFTSSLLLPPNTWTSPECTAALIWSRFPIHSPAWYVWEGIVNIYICPQ